MSEEVKTRDCPGCGEKQREETGIWFSYDKCHGQDCPWWTAFDEYNDGVRASSEFADAHWREHWRPKAGDWIWEGNTTNVYQYEGKSPLDANWEHIRPATQDEIRRAMDAQKPAEPKPLRLEVGKAYRTRNGKKMVIIRNDLQSQWPFEATLDMGSVLPGGFWYDESGKSILPLDHLDIVSEWNEPSVVVPVAGTIIGTADVGVGQDVRVKEVTFNGSTFVVGPVDDCACCHGARKLKASTRPNGERGYVPYFEDEIEADTKAGRSVAYYGCPECGKPREDLYEVARRCGDHIEMLTEARKNPKPWTEPVAQRFGRVWV